MIISDDFVIKILKQSINRLSVTCSFTDDSTSIVAVTSTATAAAAVMFADITGLPLMWAQWRGSLSLDDDWISLNLSLLFQREHWRRGGLGTQSVGSESPLGSQLQISNWMIFDTITRPQSSYNNAIGFVKWSPSPAMASYQSGRGEWVGWWRWRVVGIFMKLIIESINKILRFIPIKGFSRRRLFGKFRSTGLDWSAATERYHWKAVNCVSLGWSLSASALSISD